MDNISTSTCPTFACVLGGNLVAVKQDNDPASSTAGQVFFKTFKNRIKPSPSDNSINNIKEVHALLHSYFALDVQLDELYSQWNSDPNFKSKAGNFRGVRILE